MKNSLPVRLGRKFLAPELQDDIEASIFSFTLLVAATVLFYFGVQNWIYNYPVLTHRMIEASVVVYFAMWWLRRSSNIKQACNIFQVGVFHAIIVSSFWSGGLHSNNFIWIPIAVFVAAFYLDFKGLIFWGGAYFLGGLAWHFGPQFGLEVKSLMTSDTQLRFKLTTIGAAIITSLWVAWNYRRSRDSVAHIVREQEVNLLKANTELEVARAQAELQLEENVNLVRMLTHDIANPLSIIEMWQIFLPDDSQAKPRITRALDSMKATLSYVRDYRAVLDGKKVLNRDKVNFRNCVTETLELFTEKMEAKSLKIALQITDEDLWVRGDQRVFSNLVLANIFSNAIKFSYEGGLIELLLKCEEERVIFVLRDHGIGIPQQIMQNIFQINKATSRAGTSGEKGTGYGMPLIKHYVEMLEGNVNIESWDVKYHSHHCGTEIRLEFPVYQADPQMLAA